MKVIVSGGLGSGKSTVVRTAMERLGWREPAGFFTHWGGEGRGARTLFLETWDGEIHPIAHRLAEPAAPDRLPYELDAPVFQGAAIASLLPAANGHPVVIDELGLIEFNALEFAEALAEVFRGPAPVLAVIQQRALDRWRTRLGNGLPMHRVEVEVSTRDALPGQLATLFQA